MFYRAISGGLAFGLAAMALAQLPSEVVGAQAISEAQLRLEAPNARLMKLAGKVERVYGAPFSYGRSAVDSARSFVGRYRELFSVDQGVLRLEGTQDVMSGKFTAVYFNQFHDGYPVDGGLLTVLVRSERENPAVLAVSTTRLTSGKLGAPSVPAKSAVAAVRKANSKLREFSAPELVSYPGEERAHLAWRFTGDSVRLEDQQKYQVFVDAKTGEILEWRNQIFHVDVSGNVQGRSTPGLKPDQPNNPTTMGPLVGIRVNITGGNTAYTDSIGNFTIANAGSAPVTVNTTMIGRWVSVANSGAGGVLAQSQGVTPPGPANFTFNAAPTEFTTSQVNAFRQTEIVHNFAKSINPSYPGIDIVLPANVNIANTCNATFNGSAINFYNAGAGCPNTAYSTVVWHEYGHFIISRGHPSPTGEYHEGIADVTASLLGDTPWLGEDFRGQGTGPLRNAINNVNYPYGGTSVHTGGQVISGAFWHTLQQLDLTVGHTAGLALARSWYLNSILLRPAGINPGITIDVLTLDDDDANLFNGTPHYNEIATGFGQKNLTAPQLDWVTITPVSLPDLLVKGVNPARDETIRTFEYRLNVANNAGTLDPSSVKVWMSLNGGAYTSYAMASIGGNTFLGNIPMPICGSAGRYYMEAKDTQGRSTFYPRAGASAPLQVVGGEALNTTFEDTFSSNLGWTVTNTSLTSGAWVRDDPNGTWLNGAPANPENDSNDPGTFCFFTGQGTVGGAVGAQDVDGGPTQLRSPTLNLSTGNAVIEYQLWYFNDDGDDPFTVEISNNGGASWVPVETVMYTGTQNQWTFRQIVVSNYVAPTANVVMRFSAIDNPNNSITEAGLDHFVVRRIVCN